MLGRLQDDAEFAALQQRMDEIMLGKADLPYDEMLMQLDGETGAYSDLSAQTKGFKQATLNYRKIQDLELDSLFLQFMQMPLFRNICSRVYGEDLPIDCFRAMFFNKPAGKGTMLPWHQDRWSALDRDPLITVWLALDPATRANGCVQVIRGSHKKGIINPDHPSAFITDEQAAEHVLAESVEHLELEEGEVVLLHNWLLHSSDTNTTDRARRAFSVCYMDGRTVDETGATYRRIFE